jgi:DNA helicase HerA-like ATPase
MLVSSIMLAAMSRADIPEDDRRPFYLYVDEVHNFLTLAFADILSESRKYGLNLILAHQYIGQLDEKVRSAIFGNVGTIVSFRAGAEDARPLAREFYPVFGAGDLIALPRYHIYLKLMIDGTTSRPFSARTLPPPTAGVSIKREIVELSRIKYGRPRAEVESEMLHRADQRDAADRP